MHILNNEDNLILYIRNGKITRNIQIDILGLLYTKAYIILKYSAKSL